MNCLLAKTGARHRFFYVCFFRGAVGYFCGGALVNAQIVLPDAAPVQEEVAAPDSVPEVKDAEVERLIQQMNNTRGISTPSLAQPTDQAWVEEMASVNAKYELSDVVLKVKLTLRGGAVAVGRVPNQSFIVRNEVGDFPVVMNEVHSIHKTEDETAFRFIFVSGDMVIGIPDEFSFSIEQADGGSRVLSFNEVIEMTFNRSGK
ncbi:hypothetical protein P3T73_14080 [Kiritimatiellota bacterium B12222]|nr:hypothetical protein P3T73_14080 [Kiritimatiellota bacterium B12222]